MLNIKDVKYVELDVKPRYWEDLSMNGTDCDDNDMTIPFRTGDSWNIIIDVSNGKVLNWPIGNQVKVYAKVCDAGLYYLLDENKKRLATHEGYSPSGISVGEASDYVIMNINSDGFIENYGFKPTITEWKMN